METNGFLNTEPVVTKTPPWKKVGSVLLLIITISILTLGVAWGYTKLYQDKVYPGIYAGTYHLGGASAKEVVEFAENYNTRLMKEGIAIVLDSGQIKAVPFVGEGDSVVELFRVKADDLSEQVMRMGRQGEWWKKMFEPLKYKLVTQKALVPIVVNDFQIRESLSESLKPYSDAPRDATVRVSVWPGGTPEIIKEQAGRQYSLDRIMGGIKERLNNLSYEPVLVASEEFVPAIDFEDASVAANNVAAVLEYGPISLNHTDPFTKVQRSWKITATEMGQWFKVVKDENNTPVLDLDEKLVAAYLESIRPLIDYLPRDAKFVMENNKVKEFQFSRTGLKLNTDKTIEDLQKIFRERNYRPATVNKALTVTVDIEEPKVKIADVNDLGIEDVIGVGVSTFKDSHTNRIKNIAHAAKILNGVLIKPGEEFSTLRAAGPFTAENGFLPEAVIKGKEIKNEIGGGMCQIGTTMFRMAMNAGMPILERRNHSLVVSYYADPVNGNPGTDATLYEPILDFKFKNDTNNYLLVQTDIDFVKQQIVFTLWGKPDGRKGWYTHPLVSKWIPAGEKEIVVTDTLKPGEQKCQMAYRGAVASFTYSRITPEGEKIDRVFDSYYRPLPEICMVGATSTPATGGAATTTPPIVTDTTTLETP